jgi:hypothetical protein
MTMDDDCGVVDAGDATAAAVARNSSTVAVDNGESVTDIRVLAVCTL